MKLSVIIISVLLIGALFIISNQNLHLAKKEEANTFLKSYTFWLATGILKIKSITLYVVKLDWLPSRSKGNETLEIIGK